MTHKILGYILILSAVFFVSVQFFNPLEMEANISKNIATYNDTLIQKDHFVEKIPTNPYIEKIVEEYDSYVRKEIKKHGIPGAAIVIIKDSNIVFMQPYGVREVGKPDSMNVNSVFRLASLSKGFGAMITGILVGEGILCWDDYVIDYLPDFRLKSEKATQELTIRNLLSHTTALPRHAYTDCIEDGSKFDKIIYELRDVPLIGQVGQVFSYQNAIYSLITDIIEVATNKSFEEVLQEKLFDPLNIVDGSYTYEAIMKNDNVAQPHFKVSRNRWVKTKIQNKYYNTIPAGGINASIADMSQYLLAVMGHRQDVIPQDILNDMFTPQIRTYIRGQYFSRWKYARKPYYGLGWRIVQNKQDEVAYHGGFVNGYKTEIAYNISTNMGICALFNSANDLSYNAIPKFFEFYDKYRDSVELYDATHFNRQLAVFK